MVDERATSELQIVNWQPRYVEDPLCADEETEAWPLSMSQIECQSVEGTELRS